MSCRHDNRGDHQTGPELGLHDALSQNSASGKRIAHVNQPVSVAVRGDEGRAKNQREYIGRRKRAASKVVQKRRAIEAKS